MGIENSTGLDPLGLSQLLIRRESADSSRGDQPSRGGFVSLLDKALEKVTPAAEPPAPAPAAACYEVQAGDNLSRISEKLGLSDRRALARANNLSNPNQLAAGKVLAVPQEMLNPSCSAEGGGVEVQTAQAAGPGSALKTQAGGGTYVVQPGDTLWGIARKLGLEGIDGLVKGNDLQNPDSLTVGQTLTVPSAVPSGEEIKLAANRVTLEVNDAPAAPSGKAPANPGRGRLVVASWYGSNHHGQRMANGKPFNMYADTVAHRSLPLGTEVRLTNPKNGQTVQATVTDRGPYVAHRDVDVSYGVARKLGMVQAGVARLRLDGV